jgi:3-hydroxyacyl-[acyl-carrier-protein] dehydratase
MGEAAEGGNCMRFHLVDRIESYEPWQTIHARKLTSRNESYWQQDGSTHSVLPSALLLEALCQAGSWLLLLSSDLRQRAALLSIGSVTYMRDVKVGAVLQLEGHVDSMSSEMAVFSGQVLVEGSPVLAAQDIMCALLAAEQLEEREQTNSMRRLLLREDAP